jgi:hypothetical protein
MVNFWLWAYFFSLSLSLFLEWGEPAIFFYHIVSKRGLWPSVVFPPRRDSVTPTPVAGYANALTFISKEWLWTVDAENSLFKRTKKNQNKQQKKIWIQWAEKMYLWTIFFTLAVASKSRAAVKPFFVLVLVFRWSQFLFQLQVWMRLVNSVEDPAAGRDKSFLELKPF